MTLTPIPFHKDMVIKWVENHLFPEDEEFSDKTAQAIGFHNKSGNLVAGVVYHNYCKASQTIEMSAYSSVRRWTNKSIIRLLFDYPFRQIGCRLVVARYSERNTRVRRIWTSLGAIEHIIPELRDKNEAEIIAVLSKEAWEASKFKETSNGQGQVATATSRSEGNGISANRNQCSNSGRKCASPQH